MNKKLANQIIEEYLKKEKIPQTMIKEEKMQILKMLRDYQRGIPNLEIMEKYNLSTAIFTKRLKYFRNNNLLYYRYTIKNKKLVEELKKNNETFLPKISDVKSVWEMISEVKKKQQRQIFNNEDNIPSLAWTERYLKNSEIIKLKELPHLVLKDEI